MHILEITYSWPAETFIVRHINALKSRREIDITVGYRSPQAQPSSSIQDAVVPGVNIKRLPNFDHLTPIQKVILWIGTYGAPRKLPAPSRLRDRVMLQVLSYLKPDLIHFHTSSLAVMMARYARQLDIPYTFSLRGTDVQVMPLTIAGYSNDLSEITRNARAIHTVADALAYQLEELCGCPINWSTIRTCVPFPEVVPAVETSQDRISFISIGRLQWQKAYHDLIRAMQYLPEKFVLDIVGDGPEKEHLTYLIHSLRLEQRVTLHGTLPYDKIQKLLHSATAYVQTSIAEGFSNALAESMAAGLPVFTTTAGGTSEVLMNGSNGIVLPMGNPEKIAEKLLLARDPDQMQRLRSEARETAIREFSEESHASQFLQFYKAALRSGHPNEI